MDQDEEISFTQLSVCERIKNMKLLQSWFQNQKTAIINTELFTIKLFDELQCFCNNTQEVLQNVPEFMETKQLVSNFYEKAQRINIKQNNKIKLVKQKQETQKQRQAKEDDEVENNRDILIEVKSKLQFLIKQNISIPFIINFIKSRINKSNKLTLQVDDCLLDAINFTFIKLNLSYNSKDQSQCKIKELILQLLEIIWDQRNEYKQQLNEIFFKLKRSQLLKVLNNEQEKQLDKFTLQSCNILKQLSEFCDGVDVAKLSASKTNGLYNFQRLLLSFCWVKQIELTEMLLHTKICGRLDKLKIDKDHSNVIRLRQKITFLRSIYRIPIVKEWCDKNKIIPFEIFINVPQYLQEEYDQYMSDKKMQHYPDQKEDHFIESQLKFLAINFFTYKQKLKIIFKDLRFQQNKIEIYELYREYIDTYQGDFERVSNLQFPKHQKDIIIACCLYNIEIKLNEDEMKKQITTNQIIKFDFLDAKNKIISFYKTSYDKYQYSCVFKFQIIKIFFIDMISLEQPFPYILEFLYYEDGKLQQQVKNISLQGQFFYCQQIRDYLSKKYQFNVNFEEKDRKVIFTYIPIVHLDYVKLSASIAWEDIVQNHFKLMIDNRHQLINEINYVVQSQNFKQLKQKLSFDTKNQIVRLMTDLEAFNQVQYRNKQIN